MLAVERSFSHIVVDRVETVYKSVQRVMDVVFMTSYEGVLHKYVVLRPPPASHSEACLIQRTQVTPGQQTIASLTLDKRNVSSRK